MPKKWAVGVTAVPSRYDGLLPRTLASLKAAGFSDIRIFVDGDRAGHPCLNEYATTFRYPQIKAFGNWILALWEIYLRTPNANFYAMFQDDFVTYKNLRQYLERQDYPERGYWNLLSMPDNEKRAGGVQGWHESNQCGKGAVGLVFNRETVTTILSSYENIVERPMGAGNRSFKAIDGAVVDCLKKKGWTEYCHYPSLVLHVGIPSALGHPKFPDPKDWRGEDFDAMSMIAKVKPPELTVMDNCIVTDGAEQIHYREASGSSVEITDIIGDGRISEILLDKLIEETKGTTLLWVMLRRRDDMNRKMYEAREFRQMGTLEGFYYDDDAVVFGRKM